MGFCTPSQGLGEAGMFLGSSVFFAIQDAVTAARRERGLTTSFTLNSPATPELIRMNCMDQFTEMVRVVRRGSCCNLLYMNFQVLGVSLVTMTNLTGQVHLFQWKFSFFLHLLLPICFKATAKWVNLSKWWFNCFWPQRKTHPIQSALIANGSSRLFL